MTHNVRFRDWLDERMRDPRFQAAMEELEPAYQVARLRMKRGLTQKELARLVGTRQSSISRLESGKSQPSVSFLRRIANALKARLVVEFVPQEESVRSELEVRNVTASRGSSYWVTEIGAPSDNAVVCSAKGERGMRLYVLDRSAADQVEMPVPIPSWPMRTLPARVDDYQDLGEFQEVER
jgi:transcriptional regulator with XRE-family HTH domain